MNFCNDLLIAYVWTTEQIHCDAVNSDYNIRNSKYVHSRYSHCSNTVTFITCKVTISLYKPWRPFGLREVEAPKFLDIRLTDGGKVVGPTRRPPVP
jgi:hypothetical protein